MISIPTTIKQFGNTICNVFGCVEGGFWIWLCIAVLFLILEMSSPGLFFFLAFFIGALCAAGTALITDAIALHCLVFLLISGLTYLRLKMWIKHYEKMNKYHKKSNLRSLIGAHGTVLRTITSLDVGKVKIHGKILSARSAHNNKINVGALVEITDVRGAQLVVREIAH